ncbi:polysaccharide pyruvyl transferase family protein [Shewanella mesophila]|uniref:polysaccharide pyruvyl transferase family protein n=1 Tax=Shewanella mesophila TaxID=2864208 RepID=UPI001C6552AA|nr:polysaccharide pyruvyl transferase family protein [Shewanella mesophila]QYJ85012.1 polysaccharide pyruvyl transferase family protein [Shewanella mesophila]
MSQQKILLAGCHSCANRGDAAILRGIVDTISASYPNAHIETLTRFPSAGRFNLPEHTFLTDRMFEYYLNPNSKFFARVQHRFLPEILDWVSRFRGRFSFMLPEAFRLQLNKIVEYDLVVMVGGSYFVDYYGTNNYDIMQLAKAKDVPVIVLGHSIGPFSIDRFNKITQSILSRTDAIVLRESETKKMIEKAGFTNFNLINGGDCAWLVEPKRVKLPAHIQEQLGHNTVAITARSLAPFDKRLGITQDQFEQKMANLVNWLNERGHPVIAVNTCTNLDSYHNDDRVVKQCINKYVRNTEMFYIIQDELNDLEIGNVLGQCQLTIGTRLHSAIISMRFGTPAFAIFYEHKSKGVLEQLNFDDRSIWIRDVDADDTFKKISYVLDNIESVKEKCAQHVNDEVQFTKRVALEVIGKYL